MFRLFIVLTVVFLLAMFVRELTKHFSRDNKEEELRDTFIEGDLVDIDLEIAEEEARQEGVRSETDEIKSENKNNKEEQ